ncbi:MAG: hypothetical protein A2096_04075 [Spirochaetes bacterium GWF1_41_5]|nr:MAG: hypothetical protein A2096_04075 [Spirochaetes bacterium GWF1_41_5]
MGLGKSSYAEGMKKASEAGDAASYLLLAGILLVLAAIFSFIGGGLTKSKKKAGWILNAVCVLITGAAYYFQLQGENGSIVIWLIIFSLAMVLSFFSAKASEKIG